MKICFVSNLYGELARGGAERIVEAEARALVAAGHAVAVITTNPFGSSLPDKETGVQDGVTVHRIVPRNLFFYTDAHRHSFAARFAWHLIDTFNGAAAEMVADILREELPDVVHTHNLMGVSFLVPAKLRRLGFRHVHTLHDVQLLHPSGLIGLPAGQAGVGTEHPPLPTRLARKAYVLLMRTVFGSPDVVISPSRFLADKHTHAGFFRKSEVRIVPNPVPEALAVAAPKKGRNRFLFVGQMEAHKGVLGLLEAWERLQGLGGGILELAGDGTLFKEVSRRAARLPGVRILGRTVGTALDAAYDRAAFVVLPSTVIENAPTVIGEAFARGVPVVANAIGGIPELVQNDVNGFLAVPGDAASLDAALLRATRHLDWDVLSANALASARERSMERHLSELLGAYRLQEPR